MKKIFVLVISLMMLLSLSVSAFAASPESIEIPIAIDEETTVTVVIPNELVKQFDFFEIEELVKSNELNNGDVITILEVGDILDPVPDAQPLWGYTYRTIKTAGPEWEAQNYFVISVAKGQTTTLSTKFSKTLKTTITSGKAFVTADIGGSITAEYSVTHQFNGPPETSPYNSREYRVQFYAKTVWFTQEKINSSNQVVDTTSGVADVPTRYAQYSIDRMIN